MKKRLLAFCLTLCLLVGLLPTAVLAAPGADGDGLTVENPMPVPEDKMVIKSDTYYGISYEWFKSINPKKQTMYFSIVLPATVTTVFDDGFRDSWSSQKERNGAATYYSGSRPTDWAHYNVVSIDFSEATNLTTINKQAAMYCREISGVLDLSNTKVKTIEKSAFSGCTGLTGVILPGTLEVLGAADGKSGSVFNGCSALQFVRTAGGSGTADFELPSRLNVIGKQCFQGCTGLPSNTTVVIPASVTCVGSEAFDGTKSAIGTIVVEADDASGYDSGAFKDNDMGYGLGKRLIVFNSAAAKSTFSPRGFSTYKNACTYEFTLHYGDSADAVTEPKLWGQAVNVCKGADNSWSANENYKIPEVQPGSVPIGYEGGWAYGGKLLTSATLLKPSGDDLYLEVTNVLQDPKIEFIVNGAVIETDDTYPELRVPAGAEIGVQVSHPIQSDPNADVQVKFEYEWTDVWQGGSQGPRMEEDGFGRYNLWDNPDVTNTIKINGFKDERTSHGNYTEADYGDGYYLVEIYGYVVPKTGGQWKLFYKSASTAIASDPDRTVNTAYLFDVTIAEPITITPANIVIYTGGEGYTGAVDNAGNESTTANGLPEPGYYITLPDELNAILGGDANAEDLSEILKFTYKDDQGRTREWNLQLYGTDSHSSDVEDTERQRYIYRMLPGVDENEQEIPVRLQFTDSDGNVTISDEFTPNTEEQYQEYTMRIYSGELDPSKITAELDINGTTVTCGIESRDGDLVIRGLTSENITTDIVAAESNLNGSNISAVLPEGGVTYYINGSNVELKDTEGVRLLVDDVLDDGVLVEYIQNNMTGKVPAGDYAYEQQYLDLVDTKNGNAYLTMGEEDSLTIYWKVPDGFDRDKPFYVVHFDALDRNYDKLETELSQNTPDLLEAQLVTVNGTEYVTFNAKSFSPFVLVWEPQNVPPLPTVKLTYHANDGSEDKLTYYYTDPVVTVKNGLFTRLDYTFDSWNSKPDGTGTTYMPSSTIHVNGDMDLYAQWIKNNNSGHGGSDGGNSTQSEFELHYRTNGGKYLSVESESYVWTKAYEELPVPVREGYSFEGWYWDFRLTDPVRSDVKVDSPVVVLYAKWTEEKDASDLTGVSNWLDTIHHKAFLSGYPDGTFGPDRNMTRAEVAQMFYSLLLDKDVKITKTFTDVPADAWYAKAVNTLASLGMLGGYPDGTFQPDRTITRAEFAVVALAFTDGGSGDSCSFTDVNRNDWFYQYAAQASTYGWIGGYPDGSFRPNNKITRAEVSVIVNNMLGRDADKRFIDRNGDELVSFTDLTDGHWAYYAIMEATNTHTYTRDGSTEVWKAAT